MFCSSVGRHIEEFTEMVLGFIGKIVDDTSHRRTIRTFPNKKPWVDNSGRDALRFCTAAYNFGLAPGNMAASYNVHRAVKEAKHHYGCRLKQQLQQSDFRGLWQGLHTIMHYKAQHTLSEC